MPLSRLLTALVRAFARALLRATGRPRRADTTDGYEAWLAEHFAQPRP